MQNSRKLTARVHAPTKLVAMAALVLTSVVAVSGYSSATTTKHTPTAHGLPSLTFGIATDPATLDPAQGFEATGEMIMNGIFDSLVYYNTAKRQYVPGLALRWSHNKNDTSYTFHLRTGVTFQDGTPFNAAAVKYTFDRTTEPALKSPVALASLGPYKDTVVLNPTTVRVDFTAPNPDFLDSVSQSWLGIVSPTAAKKYGVQFGNHPVGTGPFKFVSYTPGVSIVLTRNASYHWGPSFVNGGGPAKLSKITFDLIPDPAARADALQSDQADIVQNIPPANFLQLKSQFNMLSVAPAGTGNLLFFNTQKGATSDLRVRQALLYTLNPAQVSQITFFGVFPPGMGVLSPRTTGYSSQTAHMYPHSVKKAKALLNAAGWKVGAGGVRFKKGKPLTLIYNTFAEYGPIAEAVQGLLKPLGINVNVEINLPSASDAFNGAGKGNLGLQGYVGSNPALALSFFFDSAGYNEGFDFSRVRDHELDHLFNVASFNPNSNTRVSALRAIQVRIVKFAYAYAMCQFAWLYGLNRSVGGWKTDLLGYPYLEGLTLK